MNYRRGIALGRPLTTSQPLGTIQLPEIEDNHHTIKGTTGLEDLKTDQVFQTKLEKQQVMDHRAP